MAKPGPNVQKLHVHPLDIFRAAITQGFYRLKTVRRSLRVDFWRGSFVAEETETTVEPTDARN